MDEREPKKEARRGADRLGGGARNRRRGAGSRGSRKRALAAAPETPAAAPTTGAVARTAGAGAGKGASRHSLRGPRRRQPAPRRGPAAPPPGKPVPTRVAEWEDFEGFRETFLVHFADPEHNVALRQLGQLLYTLILEAPYAPPEPEHEGGWVRSHLSAALADLRFLQGFLGFIGLEGGEGESAAEASRLCRAAARISRAVGREAERLEGTLRQRSL